jgi:vitamin B12 transporter
MFKTTLSAAILAAALSASGFADASNPDSDNDVILVTGVRLAAPVSETGTAVTVLEADQLARSAFALDAIARTPGVTVNQNGAFGGVATVRIRGAASEQTLVLIDTVPVNDPTSPGGGYNFASLDSAQIERIEILRGAQSVLWGTDAIGGVVSIVTRRPEPGFGASGFAEIGSFGTLRGGAAIEGADARGEFRLGVSAISTDGISKADTADGNTEDDGHDAVTLAGRAGYDLGFGRLDLTLRHVSSETEYDSFGAVTGVQDGDERDDTTETSGAATLTAAHFGGALETRLQVGGAALDRETFSNGVAGFATQAERWIYRYQGAWTISEAHRLAFGVEHEDSEAAGQDARTNSLFALLELKPASGLVLTGGVRHDAADRFGDETTAKLAVSWQLSDQVRLRGAAGTGFKAPTIFQTAFFCCGAAGPNPDLVAETSEGYDIGLEYALANGRGRLEASWFDRTVENQINFSFAAAGTPISTPWRRPGLSWPGVTP